MPNKLEFRNSSHDGSFNPLRSSPPGHIRLTVPAGEFYRETLLRVAAWQDKGRLSTSVIETESLLSLSVEGRNTSSLATGHVLLLPASQELFSNPRLVPTSPGSRLLVLSNKKPPLEFWNGLADTVRNRWLEASVDAFWSQLEAGGDKAISEKDLLSFIEGALLAVMWDLLQDSLPDAPPDPTSYICSLTNHNKRETELMDQGFQKTSPLDLATLDSAVEHQEPDFRDADFEWTLPRDETSSSSEWQDRLRAFHLRGEPRFIDSGFFPDLPIIPAGVREFFSGSEINRQWPVVLPDAEDSSSAQLSPVADLLREGLGKVETMEKGKPLLHDHLDVLSGLFLQFSTGTRIEDAIAQIIDQAPARFDASAHALETLQKELGFLQERLPRGVLVNLDADSAITLHLWHLIRNREQHLEDFHAHLRQLVASLEMMLLSDDLKRSDGPSTWSAGREGDVYLDPRRMATLQSLAAGSMRLERERRARIEQVLSTLKDHLASSENEPLVHLIAPTPIEIRGVATLEATEGRRGVRTAIELFDQVATRWIKTFRAEAIARLEIEEAYLPEVHGPVLERMEWRSLEEKQLKLIPTVILRGSSNLPWTEESTSLHELVVSGRPVHLVLESQPEFDSAASSIIGGFDAAAFFMSQRQCHLLQSSPAFPEHLIEGLQRMAAILRPAVLLTPPLPSNSNVPEIHRSWLNCQMATLSRRAPLLVYDPDLGPRWADRLSIEHNPELSSDWIDLEIFYKDEKEAPARRSQPLTPAHSAALDSRFRCHFQVIPAGVVTDDLLEIGDYLSAFKSVPPRAVPFLWVEEPSGQLRRAVVSRNLAFFCHQVAQQWINLQELGGINNSHVEKAVHTLRIELEEKHQRDLREKEFDWKNRGAEEAVERIVRTLTSPSADVTELPALESSPAVQNEEATETEEPRATAADTETSSAPAEPPVSEPETSSPYIDSFLCTSCNDCIDLNSRMFQYDENKQAYISDPEAGTFEELVKAAEKCPAHCIHPGSPRPDDTTVNEQLLERARKLSQGG